MLKGHSLGCATLASRHGSKTKRAAQPLRSVAIPSPERKASDTATVGGASPKAPTPYPNLVFEGLSDNNATFPPIPNGAVGPNHIMTMLTTQTRITDRTGTNVLSTVSTLDWWSNNISGGVLWTGDVRTLYDPYSARWIAVSDVDPVKQYSYTNTPYVLVAVSQTSQIIHWSVSTRIKSLSRSTRIRYQPELARGLVFWFSIRQTCTTAASLTNLFTDRQGRERTHRPALPPV